MEDFKLILEQKQIKNISISQYLENSLNSDKETELCRGWDYLKENIVLDLKNILLLNEYWELKYNSQKVEFIINKCNLNLILEEFKKQLDSFVYIYNKIKREIEEKTKKEETEKKLFNEGYRKIFNIDKTLHGLKVKCIMDISKIGILGSFNMQEELEGKLFYSEGNGALMLMPKRSRSRGYIIRDFAYIKEN